jgi:hypothetical protein
MPSRLPSRGISLHSSINSKRKRSEGRNLHFICSYSTAMNGTGKPAVHPKGRPAKLPGGLSASLLRRHNNQRLLLGSTGRARIQPQADSTLGFAHRRWGDLHGRNIASALMWSRLRNRTRYRGGEPIRINRGGIALGPSRTGRGRSLKGAEDNLIEYFVSLLIPRGDVSDVIPKLQSPR